MRILKVVKKNSSLKSLITSKTKSHIIVENEMTKHRSEMCGKKRLVTSTEKQLERELGLNDN